MHLFGIVSKVPTVAEQRSDARAPAAQPRAIQRTDPWHIRFRQTFLPLTTCVNLNARDILKLDEKENMVLLISLYTSGTIVYVDFYLSFL